MALRFNEIFVSSEVMCSFLFKITLILCYQESCNHVLNESSAVKPFLLAGGS